MGSVYREFILSRSNFGEKGLNGTKAKKVNIKAPPSYLTCLPPTYLTSTTWCPNQKYRGCSAQVLPSVPRQSIYIKGMCMPAGLLPKHSQGAFPPRNKNRITQTIAIIKTTASYWHTHTPEAVAAQYLKLWATTNTEFTHELYSL